MAPDQAAMSQLSGLPSSGLKTAIIELKYWGGVCNNVGCIPTKALLRNAEIAHIFNHEAEVFGISGDVTFDFGAAWKRSRTAADRMAKGVHFLMKKNKITEIDGWATFTDDHTFSVDGPQRHRDGHLRQCDHLRRSDDPLTAGDLAE